MPARYSKFFRALHIIGDILLLNFSFSVVISVYHQSLSILFTDHYIKQFLYVNLFWIISTMLIKIYDINRVMRYESIFSTLIKAFLLHNLLIFSFVIVFKEYIYSINLYLTTYFIFILLICLWKLLFLYALKFIRTRGLNYRNVIIVGAGPIGEEIFDFFMKHPEHGYRFLGFFDDTILKVEKIKKHYLGNIESSFEFALKHDVDEIYCALPDVSNEKVLKLKEFSDKNLIRLKLLPDFRGFLYKKVEINFYDTVPVLILRKEPLENPVNRMFKRFFDIIFSLFLIITVFPWLFLIISILVKCSSKGPVFFKQLRSGKDNEKFMCYKFRSMQMNDLSDHLQASHGDPRITSVGRFLRRSNLDELPQFFNVLLGSMSVVGPRPHMLKHTEEYSEIIDKFMVRHFVKPGITGLAQAKGFRGETSDHSLMEKRVQYDVWYIENWSFFLDLKIIFNTVWNMLIGDEKAH
jgi:putative colanic acid biosynthesis UDP-glucose lipid carrier transferase